MYLDKIRSVYNFNKNVVRNTPIFSSRDDDLSDLIDDKFDVDVAKKTIDTSHAPHFRKIEHHAIDYVFNQKQSFQSRFSDGSYPVWYASLNQETTFFETAFHWHRTIIEDMHYDDDEPIVTNRSLFNVSCNAMLIDLRKSIKDIPGLTDGDLDAYKTTQTISQAIHNQGHPGLYTISARNGTGENIAIYNRKVLNKVEQINDVKYVYDFKQSKTYIFDKSSEKIIMEF